MRNVAIALVLTLALPAAAAEVPNWDAWRKTHRYKCPGPFDTLKSPRKLQLGGKSYTHTGYRLEADSFDADNVVKIGVISAIKDVSEGTKRNLAAALAWFHEQNIEWLVVNGDLALEEFDLEEVIRSLGQSGFATLIVIGNSESKGSWARVLKETAGEYPNLINGVWVRQVVADDVEFWTVPGYYDKRFVHQGAGCAYSKSDIDAMLKDLHPAGKGPVVLVSHGPPLGKGKASVDWMSEKKNVGDPQLTELIQKAKIPFGIFGHILEAGGAAVGRDLATTVRPSKLSPYLYINAGSLSGDPWAMNDGSTSYGMAFVVTIDGKQAKYETKRMPAPKSE